MDVGFAISIISIIVAVLSFAFARKDKSNADVKEEQKQFSKHDLIEYRLDELAKKVDKILDKLDAQDKETDEKIKTAMKHHIAEFHHNK